VTRGALLDTCVVIWWANGNTRKISVAADRLLRSPDTVVSLAAFSIVEIAVLTERKRLTLDKHWKLWVRQTVSVYGWSVLPATWEVMEEAYSLPGEMHGDPADRILVATARLNGLTLVTPDEKLLNYPHVETLW